jgi:hypothetical protein
VAPSFRTTHVILQYYIDSTTGGCVFRGRWVPPSGSLGGYLCCDPGSARLVGMIIQDRDRDQRTMDRLRELVDRIYRGEVWVEYFRVERTDNDRGECEEYRIEVVVK